jgi:hypothetical protein
MKFKIFKVLTIATILISFAIPQNAFADGDPDGSYWDKDRSYNSFIDGNDVSLSTVVISAKATYKPSANQGRERIRMWARVEQVWNALDLNGGFPDYNNLSISKMNLRFYSRDSRATGGALQILANDPVEETNSFTVPGLAYTILGYFGDTPSLILGSIEAKINSIKSNSGVKVLSESGRNYDKTLVFYPNDGWYDGTKNYYTGQPIEKADLPATIPFRKADGEVVGKYSGVDMLITYSLDAGVKAFKLWPQGQVQYKITTSSPALTYYFWTGAVWLEHTVN